MKLVIAVLFLAWVSSALEQPVEYPTPRKIKIHLHYLDWNGPGKSKNERIDILERFKGRINLGHTNLEVNWNEYGVKSVDFGINEYQMALVYIEARKAHPQRTSDTLWVGKHCELEYFVGQQEKKDSLILSIYDGAEPKIKKEIFKSKHCGNILNRARLKYRNINNVTNGK